MASASIVVSNGKTTNGISDVNGSNIFEKPLSIPEITKKAGDYYFDPQVSLRVYFRTADHILQQASAIARTNTFNKVPPSWLT